MARLWIVLVFIGVALTATVVFSLPGHARARAEAGTRRLAAAALPVTPTVAPAQPNVVLIFVDTLRADHLGAYGYGRPTSPRIDRFAEQAVQFDDVHAQAPNTPRSFPSIITGRWPSSVGWRQRFANFASMSRDNDSLFEIFHAAGYRTEVVSAHWYFEIAKGLAEGVDVWDNRGVVGVRASYEQSDAPDVTTRALEHLDTLAASQQPFVLMVHYCSTHSRYMPHPEVADFGAAPIDLYDGEIAFVDHHLTPLLDRLDRAPLVSSTIVVLFADHGEAFGEHGLLQHGRTLYEEETRVPLLIRAPGTVPGRVRQRVALVDLLPTLVQLVGLDAPRAQGVSLAAALHGQAPSVRPIYAEQLAYPAYPVHLAAVVGTSGIKVIRNLSTAVDEAYDLVADPGEQHDLLRSHGGAAAAERALLDAFVAGDPEARVP